MIPGCFVAFEVVGVSSNSSDDELEVHSRFQVWGSGRGIHRGRRQIGSNVGLSQASELPSMDPCRAAGLSCGHVLLVPAGTICVLQPLHSDLPFLIHQRMGWVDGHASLHVDGIRLQVHAAANCMLQAAVGSWLTMTAAELRPGPVMLWYGPCRRHLRRDLPSWKWHSLKRLCSRSANIAVSGSEDVTISLAMPNRLMNAQRPPLCQQQAQPFPVRTRNPRIPFRCPSP